MQLDKVILKAVGSTLAAIFVLLVAMFAACTLFFPSTMMYLTYNLGMEESAVKFAERAYRQNGGVYYIACATEIAIGENDFAAIEKCGEKLIKDRNFKEYCARMDEATADDGDILGSYAQYIYGHTYSAKYKNGKTGEALEAAFGVCQTGFPRNNAVVALTVVVLRAEDQTSAAEIERRLETIRTEQATALSGDDAAYLQSVIDLVKNYNSGGQ